MTNTFHAMPYDTSKKGFYFTDFDSYIKGVEASGAEEFELQFIDGDDAELFNACGINQANLAQWFDDVEVLDDHEKISLFYLMDNNLCSDLSDALDKIDDVSISQCSLRDAAEELFDECYLHDVPEHVRAYIDYDRFANDCRLGGDMDEFTYQGETYTCTNANSI
jgi:hypothetical protein